MSKMLPDFADACNLPTPHAGWHDYGYRILMDGTLALVRVNRDFEGMSKQAISQEWSNFRLRISKFDGVTESDFVELPPIRWPHFSRFADGRWLVVSARAAKGEGNAYLFSADGSPVGSFAVGDGVSHVRCSMDGRILVGYFDEGIFGGTRDAAGIWPPASHGLASFDDLGNCKWRFDTQDYAISDCYALSTSGSAVWASAYTDFPVIRIDKSGIRMWENSLTGVNAIAGNRDHVILAGGYKNESDRVALLRLDEKEAVPVAGFRLSDLNSIDLLQGHDGVLHVVADGRWLRIAIRDWLAALA
jgi:hypothetical protein